MRSRTKATLKNFGKSVCLHVEEATQLSFNSIIIPDSAEQYGRYSTQLLVKETHDIYTFALNHNIHIETLFQAALILLLKMYTQQSQVILGITTSNGTIDLNNIGNRVGLFCSTLPLIINTNFQENIISFLKLIEKEVQLIKTHSYSTLNQIQSFSGIKQSLFNVLFVYNDIIQDDNINQNICHSKAIN